MDSRPRSLMWLTRVIFSPSTCKIGLSLEFKYINQCWHNVRYEIFIAIKLILKHPTERVHPDSKIINFTYSCVFLYAFSALAYLHNCEYKLTSFIFAFCYALKENCSTRNYL